MEKATSLLTGRPPQWDYRKCKVKLSCDIAEDVLMRGGGELVTAIGRLDAEGCNKNGERGTYDNNNTSLCDSVDCT